jgi:hypothetical protein
MTYTEPCVTKEYLIGRNLKEESPNVYVNTKYLVASNFQTGQQEAMEQLIKFIIHDVDPEYGTDVELFVNYKLALSGYYTDQRDFEQQFHQFL